MLADGAKVGRWQPVSSGRHAFDLAARSSEPGELVRALCGIPVSSDELQRVADELAWIGKATCMDCWRVLAKRTR
ncbi:zinc finger protein [Saccharopolyspora sp. MS10]|uniref:zinc finger protein n=1 Tax=Saccharopolyspora sp. MS10 TaxID=3385973 RepID=UPI0039A24E9A